jgi:hypothetical protein
VATWKLPAVGLPKEPAFIEVEQGEDVQLLDVAVGGRAFLRS